MSSAPTKRTVLKTIRLTPDELTTIERHAHAVGLPPATYLRELALGRPLRARRKFRDLAGLGQAGRLGNNLRQLLRMAQDSGATVQADLEETIEELYGLFEALGDAVATRHRE